MWTTLLPYLLPLVEKLGVWWIENYFSDQTQKQAALTAFETFINLHKNDGNLSASEHESYQQQIDQANGKKNE